jgi:hypothetical protein
MGSVLLPALFGIAMGLRHAFEPDHVTAVAAMVVEQRSARSTLRYATLWGVGHALVLVVVAAILLALKAEMPERLALAFEVAVAVVLVALGARALLGRGRASVATGPRPLLVGIVHGLAGSGAMTALAIASSQSAAGALSAVALYALGAVLGMALLAGAAGPLLSRLSSAPRAGAWIVRLAGVGSVTLGLFWGGKSLVALTQL